MKVAYASGLMIATAMALIAPAQAAPVGGGLPVIAPLPRRPRRAKTPASRRS
ncbi:hypothetical protein QP166_02960 [Sphingomonas sp. LR60]|uniref:hypothetical protein n=1 Tax=Sphingomonas sp. LR60 TaxID=3050233 RepID=UPI002FE36E24